MAKKKAKFYVVWEGVTPGIYDNWAACQAQIKGYPNARFKSFPSRIAAEQAYNAGSADYIGQNKTGSALFKAPEKQLSRPTPILPSLSVDAACSGNPGRLEYQGVDTESGIRIFHMGPFPIGTVNLGEFLALVHGLAYLKQKNSTMPIYTDSKTAMAWVRNKAIKTTMQRKPSNQRLFSLTDRAVYWLKNNDYQTQIIKWPTEEWGEIPADFGRK